MHLWDWSPDGRFLVYSAGENPRKYDLWALPLAPDSTGLRKPIPIANTDFRELDAHVSPDGRWIAYISDESGRDEVYVQPFRAGLPRQPGKSAAGRWLLSNGTLGMVHWRRDGRELVYMSLDGAVISVSIGTGPAFQAGTPQLLFRRDEFTVVLNWMAGFKRGH